MDAPLFNGPPGDTDVCTEDFDTCPCPWCVEWRANREPDDDGEDFRGGEAAAYEREQQDAAQKLK